MAKKITRREFSKTTILATGGIIAGCHLRNRFDIVIKNGLVFSGDGSEPQKIDIGIKDGKITAIDKLESVSANRTIDAAGLAVAPGFIDIHTHTDTELLVDPRGQSKIHQGVTTEISGNCGYSPFPLNEDDRAELDQNLSEKYGIHADWRDTAGFLTAIERKGTSLNYVTLTGHGNLRAYVVGKNDVAPTAEQMKQMKRVLAESLEQGSFGLSTGLEYAPGSYASTEELIELSKVVAAHQGIYATHMRNEDDFVEEAVAEALRICREAEVSTEISHLKACNQNNWHKVDHLLEMISNAIEQGLPVLADRYPYIAYSTGLSTFLPLWARQGSTDEILQRLQDNSLLPKIRAYAAKRGSRIGGWDRVVIASCNREENKQWQGKSIAECSRNSSLEPFEFIQQLLIAEHNSVDIVGFAMNEDNLKKVLQADFVTIGSDGNAISPTGKLGQGKPHPRYYGTFPRVLGKYGREEKLFDLATAIKKMTGLPAKKFYLKSRGLIAKGYFADITIFDPATVIDKATFVDPHHFAAGIKYVLVNGVLTIDNEKHTGALSGQVLRHAS
ncbi:hypothetical protein B6D60_09150 [candidate division KSB1 bacterium 4484_87]|nr:MAG: hypothetical protein B6D60_09150 [candidate division KSB1 bacterium 4484_87]